LKKCDLGLTYKAIGKMIEGTVTKSPSIADRINKNQHKSKMPIHVELRHFCRKENQNEPVHR